jgi:hypothetical protein
VGEYFDHGASYYYVATRSAKEYIVPIDRLSLAVYLKCTCYGSESEKEGTKVILIFDFSMSQWYVDGKLLLVVLVR